MTFGRAASTCSCSRCCSRAPRPPRPRASCSGSRSGSCSTATAAPRSPTRPAGAPSARCTASTSRASAARAALRRAARPSCRTARSVPLSITAARRRQLGHRAGRRRGLGPGRGHLHLHLRGRPRGGRARGADARPPTGAPLVVFNWSPVQWDQPLEPRDARRRRSPRCAAPRGGDLTLEEAAAAGLRTEPWVNERYLISYRGVGDAADPVGALPPGRGARAEATTACSSTCRPSASRGVAAAAGARRGAREAAERRSAAPRSSRQREGERLPPARLTVALPLLLALGVADASRSPARKLERPRARPRHGAGRALGARRLGAAAPAPVELPQAGQGRASSPPSRRWPCSACPSR